MFVQLLREHFVHIALIAGIVVSVVAGAIGPFVVARRMAFSVHGIAELGLTGAAGGLLVGLDATTGALIGSVAVGAFLGLVGLRERERDTTTGVVLSAGLGLGALFLSLYKGYASGGFGLLFGSITTVSGSQLRELFLISVVVLVALAAIWRPLWFSSIDSEAAAARGVPVRGLTVLFALILGATVAAVIQVTGVLLILTLLITPAATANLLTSRHAAAVAVSVGLAVIATTGGILAALAKPWPPSFFVSLISASFYFLTRLARAFSFPRVADRR